MKIGIEIISAFYGTKDVKNVLISKIKNDSIYIHVSNDLFGDPQIGVEKLLRVCYIYNDFMKTITINEGSYLGLPETDSKRLAIFYTNNNVNKNILTECLRRIKIGAIKHGVDVLVSSWANIDNCPFPIINCNVKLGNHFNIIYQISSLLMTAAKTKKYEYVSFLEHDVLYGEDYFDYEDFKGNVLSNENFIGLNKFGYQEKIQRDQPLHQLVMKFEYAILHYKNILMESIIQQVNVEPPHDVDYDKRISTQSSIHVNHGNHFTSHYNIYSKNTYLNNSYWGNASELITTLDL